MARWISSGDLSESHFPRERTRKSRRGEGSGTGFSCCVVWFFLSFLCLLWPCLNGVARIVSLCVGTLGADIWSVFDHGSSRPSKRPRLSVSRAGPLRSPRCRFFSSASSPRTHAWLQRDRDRRLRQ